MRAFPLAFTIGLQALAALASASPRLPEPYRYANKLLPAVISLAGRLAAPGVLEKRHPEYIAIATGKDEYIYHLSDKIFIRRIQDRYEFASWRICGDFAVARVELLDESMSTIPPIMAWYMIYRDERWQRLMQDDEGHFLRDTFDEAEIPPYAQRCFELSPKVDSR